MPAVMGQEEHLEAQGPRELSPLELGAVYMMFRDKISSGAIELEIVAAIDPEVRSKYINFETRDAGEVAVSAYNGNGQIRISRSAFPHTQALNGESTDELLDPTVEGSGGTNPFSPANIHYLSTLIHECTHYWQEKYGRHTDGGPFDSFTLEELRKRDTPDLAARQHASAVQIAFLVEWQLHYRNGSRAYLTSRSKNPELNVGPVDRYLKIDERINTLKHKGTTPPPVETAREKRILTGQQARKLIASSFGWLLVELRYGWKAVCQGTDSFSRNTRVRRDLPKRRRS